MKREDFLRRLVSGGVGLGLDPLFPKRSSSEVSGLAKRPNILLIMTDQQRYDSLGCTSGGLWSTPHVDQLASEGTIFESAYTPLPVCVPARVSVMTGQYPTRHGVRRNGPLSQETWTFIRQLKESGYQTAGIGKMHFFPMYADYGLDVIKLCEHDQDQFAIGPFIDDYHKMLQKEGLVDWQEDARSGNSFIGSPKEYQKYLQAMSNPLPVEKASTGWIGGVAEEYLDRVDRDRPFFAWVSFLRPHHPFNPPKPYDTYYPPNKMPIPSVDNWRRDLLPESAVREFDQPFIPTGLKPEELTDEVLQQVIAFYHATIKEIDDVIGRLLAKVDLDNTLVVFTSDHGEYLGHRRRVFKEPNLAYDDLSRVPLVARWPQSEAPPIPPGSRVANCVSLVDLAPTFLRMAKVPVPSKIQGGDLADSIQRDSEKPRRVVLIESHASRNWVAACDGEWKYIRHGDGSRELYNLLADPEEFVNLLPQGEVKDEHGPTIARLESEVGRLQSKG